MMPADHLCLALFKQVVSCNFCCVLIICIVIPFSQLGMYITTKLCIYFGVFLRLLGKLTVILKIRKYMYFGYQKL